MLLNIIDRIKIGDWREVDLKSFNDCYLIAIKTNPNKLDTIDSKSIRKVRFEIGIECGIKGKPLTILNFNVDFNNETSRDNEINKITAFTRLTNIPSKFYIRCVSMDDGKESITSGQTSINLNVNAMNLG